jgi:hypothetical protein
MSAPDLRVARDQDAAGDASADDALRASAAFMLLFSVELTSEFAGFGLPGPGLVPLPAEQVERYVGQFTNLERRLLGEPFQAARRIARWPLGRIVLAGHGDHSPPHADVYLLAHKSGLALWEVWLPATEQSFDASRWAAWLDPEADDGLIQQLWRVLTPINQALTGEASWSGTYFPVTLLALPRHPLETIVQRHGSDLVRLLFLNQAAWAFKDDLVREELARDYCVRKGGMTLFARRSGLDLQAQESPAGEDDVAGLPPHTALPFVITLELLLLERAVLQQLYEQLSRGMARSVDELLVLKQEMLDALEEYYGAITTATRFSDAVTADGERLLGIVDLYDAVMGRLESVSFEITTRYQQRMMTLQFWLTIVFGATEIGFIAAGIATWYYHTELLAVLAWTVGAALLSGAGLTAVLRGKLR